MTRVPERAGPGRRTLLKLGAGAFLALETRRGQKSIDQAIFVACDLVAIREGILEKVRERLKASMPDFPVSKLVMSATHTHTAPATEIGADGRQRGSVGWGLGHAVVGQNRRAVF